MLQEVLSIAVGNSEFLSYPLSGYWYWMRRGKWEVILIFECLASFIRFVEVVTLLVQIHWFAWRGHLHKSE